MSSLAEICSIIPLITFNVGTYSRSLNSTPFRDPFYIAVPVGAVY